MFSYTDKQLNYLNNDIAVYSVNPEFARRKNKKLVVDADDGELEDYETNTLTTPDGQSFRVVATKSDRETGFDGMAVAPIVNGQPDYSSVAVVAAGTDPNSKVNPAGPLSRDTTNALIGRQTGLSPQYQVADAFVKEIAEDPRYEVVKLTGYSQGAYMLKAGAKYHIPVTTFNAWFKYESLTAEEKAFIEKNPAMFIDYRKRNDLVILGNDFNNPEYYGGKIADAGLESGTIYWVDYKGSSHNIAGWTFDPVTGQVTDGKGGRPVISGVLSAYADTLRGMAHYQTLKSRWKSGGFSSSEQIYLDAAQGQILSSNMAAAAQTGADEAAAAAQAAIEQVQEIWTKIDFSLYPSLPIEEVEAIFASQGVTYAQFVEGFETKVHHTAAKLADGAAAFGRLNAQLQAAIERVLATDAELAQEFQQWKANM